MSRVQRLANNPNPYIREKAWDKWRQSGAVNNLKRAQLGLDPNKTSLHALKCAQLGLDPEKTSIHALKCVQLGLDPEKTSINDLERAKSRLYPKIFPTT